MLFTWYTQGQVACVFAQALARDPHASKWFSAVVVGTWTADMITGMIDAAAASAHEAVQLLFPCEATVEDALQLSATLAAHPRWKCADNGWKDGETGDTIHLGLQWISAAGDYESWALGIAPFLPMPFTRRFMGAPFIALVLRPTAPRHYKRTPAKHGSTGLVAAHLAHMDDGLGDDERTRDKWWEGTRKAKRALVSPDPMSQARAKVTFSLPAATRDSVDKLIASSASVS